MSDINLKRKVTLKRKSDNPDQAPKGKKPSNLIWFAVISLVLIAGIFGLKQLNEKNPVEGNTEVVVVSEDVNPNSDNAEPDLVSTYGKDTNLTIENSTSKQNEVSNTSNEANATTSAKAVKSKSNTPEDASVAKDVASMDAPRNKENPSRTVPIQGSLEEKARQVISGAFGNGADRKQALGEDYAEIQAKVNEIYKNKYQ